jgi:hypothetical protein
LESKGFQRAIDAGPDRNRMVAIGITSARLRPPRPFIAYASA